MALAAGLFLLPVSPTPAAEEQQQTSYGIEDQAAKRETLLDIIFGSRPKRATERGILVIDAYEDANNNGVRDEDELDLRNEIICSVDRIDYIVPAFIPGLDYNGRYKARCFGEKFYPRIPNNDIFIRNRGYIIEIDLPCYRIDPEAPVTPVGQGTDQPG